MSPLLRAVDSVLVPRTGKVRGVRRVGPGDEFEVDDERAEDLVERGLAEIVDETPASLSPPAGGGGADGAAASPSSTGDGPSSAPAKTKTELQELVDAAGANYQALKQLAADLGLEPASQSKADIVAALAAAIAEAPEAAADPANT